MKHVKTEKTKENKPKVERYRDTAKKGVQYIKNRDGREREG
jgi:CRISPR/Cas system CMR-associated protein Cmr1 (group 7 of RAMP superfamily)